MGLYLKARDALLDYAIDWSAGYLGGETITTSQWAIEPVEVGGLALAGYSQAAGRTTAVLSGGVPGHVYQVSNHVMLSNGREETRGITVRVDAR